MIQAGSSCRNSATKVIGDQARIWRYNRQIIAIMSRELNFLYTIRGCTHFIKGKSLSCTQTKLFRKIRKGSECVMESVSKGLSREGYKFSTGCTSQAICLVYVWGCGIFKKRNGCTLRRLGTNLVKIFVEFSSISELPSRNSIVS